MKLKVKAEKLTHQLTIHPAKIEISAGGWNFFAKYPFLEEKKLSLLDVPEYYFHLMLYILLYNLDKVQLPHRGVPPPKGKPVVSYSGGVDSTALLHITGGIPMHITRAYQPLYENRQIRAVNYANSYQVHTDFERVREMYIGRHGFNIGTGYSCVYIPVLPLLGTNEIAFGIVFDDLAFHYGQVFKYNEFFHNTGLYNVRDTLQKYGINITCPLAGYSEILTVKLAHSSKIKHFSSCHTEGAEDACRRCYKCFRKQAINGHPLDFDDPEIRKMVLQFLSKQPLKMAASTVYAIQKANYPHPEFKRYMDIDVSWCERVNQSLTNQFGGKLVDGFTWQTDADYHSIQEFVKTMNKPEMYIFP